jgi:hypothetical protein
MLDGDLVRGGASTPVMTCTGIGRRAANSRSARLARQGRKNRRGRL